MVWGLNRRRKRAKTSLMLVICYECKNNSYTTQHEKSEDYVSSTCMQ